MKKYFISKYIAGCFLLLGTMIGFMACDDSNDWDVDDSKAQMFTPVFFEMSKIAATSVVIQYSEVPNHKSYIVEVSKDSLQFSTIEQTLEIPAEEMVADEASSAKRYLVTINNLDAATRYSARIKATSNNNLPESKWAEITFKTISEQIVSEYTYGETTAWLKWEPGLDVNYYIVSIDGKGKKYDLTSENISKGELNITGLEPDTEYVVYISKDDKIRGRAAFKTSPKVSGEGTRYYLEGGENIQEYLNALTDEKVVLVVPSGLKYLTGNSLTVPAHMTSLTIWGLPGDVQSVLEVKSINLDNAVANFDLWIHNMEVKGTDASGDYLMNDNPSGERTIGNFKLHNSKIHTARGMLRMRGALTVQNIEIENCIIDNIGGYGVITADANTVVLNDITIKNTTISNVINGSMLTFKGVITSSLVMDHCTFYNVQTTTSRYIANFDGKAGNIPSLFTISNSIFASPDESLSLRATNPKIESVFVYDSYKTADYTVNGSYPLSGVSDYLKTSVDLFEDPASGNFKIIDPVIGGEAQPGDPRWW